MAGKKKVGGFLHHHAKAGMAFKAGDHATAMHHTGHMLSAIKANMAGKAPMMSEDAGETQPDAESPAEDKAAPFGGLRSRLTGMKG